MVRHLARAASRESVQDGVPRLALSRTSKEIGKASEQHGHRATVSQPAERRLAPRHPIDDHEPDTDQQQGRHDCVAAARAEVGVAGQVIAAPTARW